MLLGRAVVNLLYLIRCIVCGVWFVGRDNQHYFLSQFFNILLIPYGDLPTYNTGTTIRLPQNRTRLNIVQLQAARSYEQTLEVGGGCTRGLM